MVNVMVNMKKRIRLYVLFLILASVFSLYTFRVKNLGGEPAPKKKTTSRVPPVQQDVVPYKGFTEIQHDTETPNLDGPTGLDGMDLADIAAFRLQKVSIYRKLGIYPPDYHPLERWHKGIYKSITPGKAWVGGVPYFIANPYQLVILTCANRVTPINLVCPDVRTTYRNGVFETIHQGRAALCWFQEAYDDYKFPGLVKPCSINAWDAGFFYIYVDLSRCENIKESDNPRNITNRPGSWGYIYHVGKYNKNNLSPRVSNAWLTLKRRDTRTVIHTKLWRKKPGKTSEKPDLVYIFKILP